MLYSMTIIAKDCDIRDCSKRLISIVICTKILKINNTVSICVNFVRSVAIRVIKQDPKIRAKEHKEFWLLHYDNKALRVL